MRELIKQWLKAGYMEGDVFHKTESGTPQGGVVSPLLANIALHGMEEALTVYKTFKNGRVVVSRDGVKYRKSGDDFTCYGRRAVVRYADDFVVFCESREDAERSAMVLSEWLNERGLKLSPEKTRIVHLSEGFDFLGFNVRQYEKPLTTRHGWKLLIKPSKESVKKVRKKLRDEWRSLTGQNVKTVVSRLNPIVRGWANYFRTHVASETFSALDHWMYYRELRYARRAHPQKSKGWIESRYWGRLHLGRKDKWVFGDKCSGIHLLRFMWLPIERHTLVKGWASPDDPTLRAYWKERNKAQAKDLTPSKQKIALRQKGICPCCGDSLFNEEEIHVHHRKHRKDGGSNSYGNLQLLHLFCHQQLHARQGNELCVT
jgi:RNA-directed DNA polymerase